MHYTVLIGMADQKGQLFMGLLNYLKHIEAIFNHFDDLAELRTPLSPIYTHRLTRIGIRIKLTRIRINTLTCINPDYLIHLRMWVEP